MSLEKASIVWSAKQLSGMIKNDKIDFNHIIQRSYVWERTRKTGLIESMIVGYPIPPVFAKRMDDGTGKRGGNIYYIMDGKQRLSTVKEYLNDEFALTSIPPVNYFDEEKDEECAVDISGMKFSALPDALKDHLNNATFNVTYFDNLTKEEERELTEINCQGTLAEHKYAIFYRSQDWLNKKMFDYRGLIEKGLAIEVTKENNPYE
jgi:hypothetical protein